MLNARIRTYENGGLVATNVYNFENLDAFFYYIASNYSTLVYSHSSIVRTGEMFTWDNVDASLSVVAIVAEVKGQ